MRTKIVMIIVVLIGIFLLTLFSFGIKEKAIGGIIDNVPEYDCSENNLCTSCMIEGNTCSCGQHTCDCGNKTVDRKECILF